MGNFTAIRPGQINAGGATDALFLKLYSGEVLNTFANENLMLGLTRVRTLTKGKSSSFIVTGVATGGYHQPGIEIDGQTVKQNERVISIDDVLLSTVFLDDLEEIKNHWDQRSAYTREQGVFLANQIDKKLQQTVLLAARASSTLSGVGFGGLATAKTNIATDKAVLKASIQLAAQTFDEKNVPATDRHAILRPAQHYLLLQDDEVINSRYDVGGSSRKGTVGEYSGIMLHKSNQLPSGVVAGNTGENNTYSGTFTNTVVAVFQKEAVGTVQAMGMRSEMDYIIEKQGWMIVQKYAMGHGILRPECAIEFTSV